MSTYSKPSPEIILNNSSNTVKWSSPSNIAIIKYWGKYGRQLPRNPSISFTLNNAKTTTKISYKLKDNPSESIKLQLWFEGKRNEQFENKMIKFFESITDIMPFLKLLSFEISSSNSFPHSAGIASSASAMSAIACCLCDIEKTLFNTKQDIDYRRVSFIARLGSGSASRSVYSTMALWGDMSASRELKEGFSDLYAVGYEQNVAPIFKTYHDDILIVSKKEKSVSSSAGHQLMESNVYADARYKQAVTRMDDLLIALENGDQETFGKIAEDEALTLHALMMSSDPSYLLIHPNTLHIIEKIRSYRKKTGFQVYFTLDAGPNIHLLYADNIASNIKLFIKDELLSFCEEGYIVHDMIGNGPIKLI